MDVLMPQLGETVSDGKIVKWFKSVGEAVAAGENLCEVETDKVTIEVPALEGGFVSAINAEAGDTVPVGSTIAVIDGKSSKKSVVATTDPVGTAPGVRDPVESASVEIHLLLRRELDLNREVRTPLAGYGPAKLSSGLVASPLARCLAANRGIDLATIAPTHPSGRIKGTDVERPAVASRSTQPSVLRSPPDHISEALRKRPHTVVKVDGMRRTVAERLALSKTSVPHFYLATDIAVDSLSTLRRELNQSAKNPRDGEVAFKLSINDFVIKAWSLALQVVPAANAIWANEEILQFEHSDVGVAVAVPGGLLTPVIHSADRKSLSAISNEMNSLASRARERSLLPTEYQGGTTSISNLGMYGVSMFTAIINPPQSTIIAIGAQEKRAVEAPSGNVALEGRITATLSCDHRVVDGVLGAELLRAFKSFLEHPLRMLA
jgi:pyruvate dehydrogenase E2 component (dihydrolipoamide acetyltransferase)